MSADKSSMENTKPYLGINIIPGGHGQHGREDCWGIMKKGILSKEYNTVTEELIEGIPFSEGYDKVIKRLEALSEERGLPIRPTALKL